MLTMREYAHQCGVSYEAVRQQVKRYSADLVGHVHKQGRTQYLDDWAVDFLNAKRLGNPVVVAQTDLQEQLKQLRDENKALLIKVAAQADELAGAYRRMDEARQLDLESKKAMLRLEAETDARQRAEDEAKRARTEAQRALEEAERLRADLKAEQSKSWLQKLFHKR